MSSSIKPLETLDIKIRKLNRCLSPQTELTKEAVDALVSLYIKFENNAGAIVTSLSSKNELNQILKWALNAPRKDRHVADILIEEILLSVNLFTMKEWKKLIVRDDNCICHISLQALNAGINKDSSIREILNKKTIQKYLTN